MSTHNLCFRAKIRRKNEYPCKPQFYYMKVGFTLHGHAGMMRCNIYRGGGALRCLCREKRHSSECAVALANVCHCCLTYDRFTHDLPHFIVFLIGSNCVVFHFYYALWASDLCNSYVLSTKTGAHTCVIWLIRYIMQDGVS